MHEPAYPFRKRPKFIQSHRDPRSMSTSQQTSASPLPTEHPHRAMRRSDREITDPQAIAAILHAGKVMRIALVDGDRPFLLPVFYFYDGTALYFHSALSGSKVEIMKKNPHVCFEISLDHGFIADKMICDFEARHRTVIGSGRVAFANDPAEKIRALDGIVAHFTDQHHAYPEENLKRTLVVRIDIASMAGKQHGIGGM